VPLQPPSFERLKVYLKTLGDPDFSPLMTEWEKQITEGNRRGVLSGTDGFGKPMRALKYRGGTKTKTSNRTGEHFGRVTHAAATGPGGHTAADYAAATGPRLAPFREASRVITNLDTRPGRDGLVWFAEGAWFDVVSKKGVSFLPFHFAEARGRATFPRYDLRPIRPVDRQTMGRQLKQFVIGLLRKSS
jgi:hypothetical protein